MISSSVHPWRPACAASLLALFCFVGLSASCSSGGPDGDWAGDPDGPQRVILISLDTTRADHLGCYGSTLGATPNIDEFAARATVFADVTTPAPTTLAAHTSILTGSYPHTNGIVRNGFQVHGDNQTLAERLGEAGFTSAAFIGSWALDEAFELDQGFDHWDQEFSLRTMALRPGQAPKIKNALTFDQDQRRADEVTDAVLAYTAQPGIEDERLFLFVHYFDAHAPYDPPEPFASRFAAEGAPKSSSMADLSRQIRLHQKQIGEYDRKHRVAEHGLTRGLVENADGEQIEGDERLANLYAGEIAFQDLHVGRLLAGLEARGLLKNALVVILADHGETFHEHGDFWNHGAWIYDTTVHVPLIIRHPRGLGAGSRVETPVSTIDVFPTVLELAGLPMGTRVDGSSLAPVFVGEQLERGAVFSEATQPWRPNVKLSAGNWPNGQNAHCIRVGKFKLVFAPYLGGLRELYNLEADPSERHNLIEDPELRSAAEKLFRELSNWHVGADPLPSNFDKTQVAELNRRLEALGYVGNLDGK